MAERTLDAGTLATLGEGLGCFSPQAARQRGESRPPEGVLLICSLTHA